MGRCRLMPATMCMLVIGCIVTTLIKPSFPADVGGKPEKPDVVVTYAQPSGAFTPIWVAYEAGLFKKYGLNATLKLLTPQVSAQAVISEEADFYTDGPDLINARLHGGQVKYFGGTIQQLVFQMWAAKEIKTVQDLKGKVVGASTPRAALDTATREAQEKWLGSRQRCANSVSAIRAGDLGRYRRRQSHGWHLVGAHDDQGEGVWLELARRYRKAQYPRVSDELRRDRKISQRQSQHGVRVSESHGRSRRAVAPRSRRGEKSDRQISKIDDAPTIDGTYDSFAPYWAMSLAVRPEAIKAQFEYIDEKEFPKVKNADPRDFYDNSFVDTLGKSGFLKNLGMR
jgi:NMT1/THI5 like protein